MSSGETPIQPPIASALRSAVEKKHLAHALLFSGPPGSGQIETARWLAKLLFCETTKHGDPCGVCPHCRQVDSGAHPDLFMLEPEKDSRVIKVEAVRQMISRAGLRPLTARAKVFVVNGVECLNETAQNALLKTLEEPEGHAHFVLISHASEKILATIRSRAQTFHFPPLAKTTAADAETEELRRRLLRWTLGLAEGPEAAAPPDLSKLERERVARIFDFMAESLRDVLLIRSGASDLVGDVEDKPLKQRAARRLSTPGLFERIELFGEFKQRILESANQKLALSVLWEKLQKPDP